MRFDFLIHAPTQMCPVCKRRTALGVRLDDKADNYVALTCGCEHARIDFDSQYNYDSAVWDGSRFDVGLFLERYRLWSERLRRGISELYNDGGEVVTDK